MSKEKRLGKICHVRFGCGGYQECMIGLTLDFEGDGWGCGHFDGAWAIERNDDAQWTEEDRVKQLGKTVMNINKLLKEAKIDDVTKLKGIPVECTFEGMSLKSWRILTEVIL